MTCYLVVKQLINAVHSWTTISTNTSQCNLRSFAFKYYIYSIFCVGHFERVIVLTNNDQSKPCTRQCNVHLMFVNDEAHVTLAPADWRGFLNLIFWLRTYQTQYHVVPLVTWKSTTNFKEFLIYWWYTDIAYSHNLCTVLWMVTKISDCVHGGGNDDDDYQNDCVCKCSISSILC